MSELGEKIDKAIKEQMAIKEHFIAQYLVATGARIEDTILIEQKRDQFTTVYWCEPKEPT